MIKGLVFAAELGAALGAHAQGQQTRSLKMQSSWPAGTGLKGEGAFMCGIAGLSSLFSPT